MYQVVVPKALAPKDLVKVYEGGKAVVLPAWDPMVGQVVLLAVPDCSLVAFLSSGFARIICYPTLP